MQIYEKLIDGYIDPMIGYIYQYCGDWFFILEFYNEDEKSMFGENPLKSGWTDESNIESIIYRYKADFDGKSAEAVWNKHNSSVIPYIECPLFPSIDGDCLQGFIPSKVGEAIESYLFKDNASVRRFNSDFYILEIRE